MWRKKDRIDAAASFSTCLMFPFSFSPPSSSSSAPQREPLWLLLLWLSAPTVLTKRPGAPRTTHKRADRLDWNPPSRVILPFSRSSFGYFLAVLFSFCPFYFLYSPFFFSLLLVLLTEPVKNAVIHGELLRTIIGSFQNGATYHTL